MRPQVPVCSCLFFFFQAEDGIRDYKVTGVQTCALPIFRQAVEPLGQALPEWDILGRVLRALGVEGGATRAERWFRELAAAVPAFAGLTYQAIGDTGAVLSAPTAGHPRSEPASRTPLQ